MALPAEFWTFKDIDTHHGLVKGSAFRAFKGLLEELREGEDFIYLDGAGHEAEIRALRAAGRLYRSSVNAVLLTPAGYRRLAARLPASPPAP